MAKLGGLNIDQGDAGFTGLSPAQQEKLKRSQRTSRVEELSNEDQQFNAALDELYSEIEADSPQLPEVELPYEQAVEARVPQGVGTPNRGESVGFEVQPQRPVGASSVEETLATRVPQRLSGAEAQTALDRFEQTGEEFTGTLSEEQRLRRISDEETRRAPPTWAELRGSLQKSVSANATSAPAFDLENRRKAIENRIPEIADVPAHRSSFGNAVGVVGAILEFESGDYGVSPHKQTPLDNIDLKSQFSFSRASRDLGLLNEDGTANRENNTKLVTAIAATLASKGVEQRRQLTDVNKEIRDAKGDKKKLRTLRARRETINNSPDLDDTASLDQIINTYQSFQGDTRDAQGNVARPKPLVNSAEGRLIVASLLTRLSEKSIGLLSPVAYRPPGSQAAKGRIGFNITDSMRDLLNSVKEPLRRHNRLFRKSVTRTANRHGRPHTDAAAIHKATSRGPEKIDVGDTPLVDTTVDYFGSNGNVIFPEVLTVAAVQLDDVFANVDENGVSTSIFAGAFNMDKVTFMKYWQFNEIRDYDTLIRSLVDFDNIASSDMAEAFAETKSIYSDVVAGRLSSVYDAAKEFDYIFDFPQQLTKANGRIHDDVTELNVQNEPFNRGLVSSPEEHMARGRTPADIISGKNLPRNKVSRGVELVIGSVLDIGKAAENSPTIKDRLIAFRNLMKSPEGQDMMLVGRYLDSALPKANELKNWREGSVAARETLQNTDDNWSPIKDNPIALNSNSGVAIVREETWTDPLGIVEGTWNVNTILEKLAIAQGIVNKDLTPTGKNKESNLKLAALIDLGKYIKGSAFFPKATAYPDGKTNGASSTVAQNGDLGALHFTGQVYQPTSLPFVDSNGQLAPQSSIPLGNLRDKVDESIDLDMIDSLFKDNSDVSSSNLVAVFDVFRDAGLGNSIQKDPTMTFIYGKDVDSHGTAMVEHLYKNADETTITSVYHNAGLHNSENKREDLAKLLGSVEAQALTQSLISAVNQGAAGAAASVYAAISGFPLVGISPVGLPINMAGLKTEFGGEVSVNTGTRVGDLPSESSAAVQNTVGTSQLKGKVGSVNVKIASALKSTVTPFILKDPLKHPDARKKLKMESTSFVVLTHSGDGANIVLTANDVVNENARLIRNGNKPMWFRNVFDAVGVDAYSFEFVVESANRRFNDIVFGRGDKKAWSAVGAVLDGVKEIDKQAKEQAKIFDMPGQGLEVRPLLDVNGKPSFTDTDHGDFIYDFVSKLNDGYTDFRVSSSLILEKATRGNISAEKAEVKVEAERAFVEAGLKKLGFVYVDDKLAPLTLNGKQYLELLTLVDIALRVKKNLSILKSGSTKNRREVVEKLRILEGQGLKSNAFG